MFVLDPFIEVKNTVPENRREGKTLKERL